MLRAVFARAVRPRYPALWSFRALATEGSASAEAEPAASAKPDTATQPQAEQEKDGAAAQPNEGVAELQEQVRSLKDKLLRALADSENARKIAQRDIANAREYAITEFARDMLSVADNLDRALSAVPESARAEHKLLGVLYDGVSMTQKGLAAVLEKHGIHKIPTVGEKFDPNVHNALFDMDDPSREPGTVGQMVKQGYTIKDRVLRVSDVGVVRARS